MSNSNDNTAQPLDGNEAHIADEAIKSIEQQETAQAEETKARELNIDDVKFDDLVNSPEKLNQFLDEQGQLPTREALSEAGKEGGQLEPVIQPGAEEKPGASIMVPKPRLDQEIEKNRVLNEELQKIRDEKNFLAGATAALKNGPAAEPSKPVEDPLLEIDRKLMALDTSYKKQIVEAATAADNGDITLAQWKQKEFDIAENAKILRHQLLGQKEAVITERNKPDPKTLAETVERDPELQERTDELVSQNPWMDKLSDEDFYDLRDYSIHQLNKQGYKLGIDPNSAWTIRVAMADLGVKKFGYDRIHAEAQPAPAGKPAAPAKPATDGYTPTPQQRSAKLALANKQPPMPTQAGVTAPTDVLDATNIETMNFDDLVNLPKSTLNAFIERGGRAH